jgi:hypothetical protein
LFSWCTQEWYALVASADFFFNDPQNESMAEQLRERVRFFGEQNRERDFYFVPEPKWLDAQYPELAKKVKRPCVALVSTDKNWIMWVLGKVAANSELLLLPGVALHPMLVHHLTLSASLHFLWLCSFMKLRLDRVLRIDLGQKPDSEVLAVGGKVPEFKTSPKWTAPYSPYTPGWWEVFMPKN